MVLVRTAATLSLLLAVASAAPAIVWKSLDDTSLGNGVVHTSDEIKASDLLSELQTASGKVSVVFLLGRSETGSESLTIAAPQLQKVSEKHESASFIHHHVSGIQSGARLVSDAVKRLPDESPLLLNLQELGLKLNETSNTESSVEMEPSGGIMSKSDFKQSKRERAVSSASVLVVEVSSDTSPDVLDAAVVQAIEHSSVGTVVLSAVRSIQEVKQERSMEAKRRWLTQQKAGQASTGHRRLEDANAAAEENANANQDMTGVYYVSMTPNILAGLLFFLLFVVVTWIGVSCMGMIAGQDVYVNKLPSIGREA